MPSFGKRSTRELETCHPRLRQLFKEVVKHFDCAVICGRRGKAAQDLAVAQGFSKVEWPNSKHNTAEGVPSLAVDVVPYPIDWDDKKRFYHFAGYVRGVAQTMGLQIRWGGDWDGDKDLNDQTFIDLPHFEFKGAER